MTLVVPTTGEVVSEDDYLDALASRVRAEHRRSKEAIGEAVDAYFAIGKCLMEAREVLTDNQSFGAWFRAQEFGFTQRWAHTLRQAAEHEPMVREAFGTQVLNGEAPNIKKAVKQAVAANGGGRAESPALPAASGSDWTPPDEAPTTFTTVVADPPWRYDNVTTRGAAEDHYPTMSMAELVALDVPAADTAHLYLWVTNPFMREGLDLCDAWGFTYKTLITWVKPQMGMGNYFRSATEHVIFGIRGSLPTNRNDVMTWFQADRTRHSQKPESFYDLVESCSPGPYLEMFARRRRFGWHHWGNEV